MYCMRRYTEEQLIGAITESVSVAQVLTKLELKPSGGNYKTINNFIDANNINTDHFKGQSWSRGKSLGPKRNIEDYLSNEVPIGSFHLKNRLFSDGVFEKKCYNCGIEQWMGKPAPLELEHINGNNRDNGLDNLTILCPNCHAFTETYRGKNIGKRV